jgi:hypothetical protein
MSNGRSERRIARAVSVELRLQEESVSQETAWTENVSAHGARVLLEWKLQPGQRVLVNSPKEGVRSDAWVIYCHWLAPSRFAIGLELKRRAEPWSKAY